MLTDELNIRTRELAGAGDAAIGMINPERASGTAIMAARDQAQLPLNQNVAAYRQLVEDIASIWFNLWVVYHPNGIEFEIDGEEGRHTETISAEELDNLRVNVRIDVSNNTPFSKFAKEQAIEFALHRGYISFEEYVGALEDDSNAPKSKFEEILKNRELAAMVAPVMPFDLGGVGGMPILPNLPLGNVDNALGGVV